MRVLIAALLLAIPLACLAAQEDEDHEHHHLHLSHPLVTESPSPDTKIRLDYMHSWSSEAASESETEWRVEGEYAFVDALSLAVVAPYIVRTESDGTRVSSLGSVELSLKAASLRFGESGILVGGGLSAALPTGSDSKGIGSGHLVELAPFVDIGYKKDAFELVGLGEFSTTVRRRSGDAAESALTLNGSALYQIRRRLEVLLELVSSRALAGPDSGTQETFVAPGIKLYPFPVRRLMLGASVELGIASLRDNRALLVSGFYHF